MECALHLETESVHIYISESVKLQVTDVDSPRDVVVFQLTY